MKKTIQIRNYWFLLGIVHFALMWGVKRLTQEKIEILDIEFHNNFTVNSSYWSIMAKQDPIINTYFYFFFFSLFLILIIFSIVTFVFYKTEIKFFILWFLIYGILISKNLIEPMHLRTSFLYDEGLHQVVFFLTFFPYAYFLIKYTILGMNKDISDELIQSISIHTENEIQKLRNLQNAEILTQNEVDKKSEKIIKAKLKHEILLSEEYNLLCQLEKSGTLSHQEVEYKIEELINKRFQEQNKKSE